MNRYERETRNIRGTAVWKWPGLSPMSCLLSSFTPTPEGPTHTVTDRTRQVWAGTVRWWHHRVSPSPEETREQLFLGKRQSFPSHALEQPRRIHASPTRRNEVGSCRKPTPQPSSSNVDPERIPYLISEHLPPRSQAPRWAVLRLTEVRGTFLHRRQAVESTPLPPLLRATGGRADLLGTEPVRFSGPMLRGLHLVKCSSFATVNP